LNDSNNLLKEDDRSPKFNLIVEHDSETKFEKIKEETQQRHLRLRKTLEPFKAICITPADQKVSFSDPI